MLPLQPQAHSQNDISDIYRFPLVTKGIFVNPALQEPFGLTVIEVRLTALSVNQCCQPVCCLMLFSMCSAVAKMHPHKCTEAIPHTYGKGPQHHWRHVPIWRRAAPVP